MKFKQENLSQNDNAMINESANEAALVPPAKMSRIMKRLMGNKKAKKNK